METRIQGHTPHTQESAAASAGPKLGPDPHSWFPGQSSFFHDRPPLPCWQGGFPHPSRGWWVPEQARLDYLGMLRRSMHVSRPGVRVKCFPALPEPSEQLP